MDEQTVEQSFPTIKELFKKSWGSFKANWLVLYGAFVVMIVVSAIFDALIKAGEGTSAGIILGIVSFLINLLLSVGAVRIFISAAQGSDAKLEDLFTQYRYMLAFFVASLLFVIASTLGFILLIVPGIIISLMLGQFEYAIVDKNKGMIESLKYSAAITKGYRWKLFWLGAVSILMVLVSMIPLFLGLLISVPVLSVLQGHVYITLRDIYEGKQVVGDAASPVPPQQEDAQEGSANELAQAIPAQQ